MLAATATVAAGPAPHQPLSDPQRALHVGRGSDFSASRDVKIGIRPTPESG